MIAPKIHGFSKDTCTAPLRGTMAGYTRHHRNGHTPPCPPCWAARTAYITEQTELWAALQPVGRAQLSAKAFAEDYLYLIATGETHPETIARRMRTNQRALERRLYRVGLHVLHTPCPSATRQRLAVAA